MRTRHECGRISSEADVIGRALRAHTRCHADAVKCTAKDKIVCLHLRRCLTRDINSRYRSLPMPPATGASERLLSLALASSASTSEAFPLVRHSANSGGTPGSPPADGDHHRTPPPRLVAKASHTSQDKGWGRGRWGGGGSRWSAFGVVRDDGRAARKGRGVVSLHSRRGPGRCVLSGGSRHSAAGRENKSNHYKVHARARHPPAAQCAPPSPTLSSHKRKYI